MSYASFAQYYDSLTHNVEYARRADYLCTLLAHLGHAPGLTLDLACGTGSLTVELAKRGMDIYGIDGVCGYAFGCTPKGGGERPGPVVSMSKNAKARSLRHSGYGDLRLGQQSTI